MIMQIQNPQNHQNFVNNNNIIQEGDEVMIYCDNDNIVSVTVKRGLTINMKHGALRHEFLIGKRYGTRLTATAGSIYALRPFPAIWTKVLKRHTQILYSPEISMIINLLDIKPGDVVCESGTGSGSLTHAFAVAVGPLGKIYTHDIETPQLEKITNEIIIHGLSDRVFPALQDVTQVGFQIQGDATAVFLDLPAPWAAITHVIKAFNRTKVCRLVSFSPCIEQAQEFCLALSEYFFINVRTVELIGTTYKAEQYSTWTITDMELSRSTKRAQRRNANNEIVKNDNNSSESNQKLFNLCTFPDKQPTQDRKSVV